MLESLFCYNRLALPIHIYVFLPVAGYMFPKFCDVVELTLVFHDTQIGVHGRYKLFDVGDLTLALIHFVNAAVCLTDGSVGYISPVAFEVGSEEFYPFVYGLAGKFIRVHPCANLCIHFTEMRKEMKNFQMK